MARSKQLDRLLARLDAIPQALKDAAVASLTKSGQEVVETMRSLAPVDSGALRDSIVMTLPGHSTPSHSTPGGQRVAFPNQVLITAGNEEVRYAALVEFGTAPHAITANASHPGSVPHAFFWPGYRLRRARVKRRTARDVFKAARNIWSER